jgi:hypothetical protein
MALATWFPVVDVPTKLPVTMMQKPCSMTVLANSSAAVDVRIHQHSTTPMIQR